MEQPFEVNDQPFFCLRNGAVVDGETFTVGI